jgi:iron complex transport system ATP-binding protein
VSVLEADQLSVRLGDAPVLRELGFRVESGARVGLIGPNGSGKTTLLRAAGGLLPYAGTLRLFGQPASAWSDRERARRLAFMRQAPQLTFDFSVEDLVLLGRTPHKPWLAGYTTADRERAHDALQQVGLGGFAERSVQALSGGERQRVFLAQALVQDADLLLLDEPTTHLDVHHQFGFMKQLQRFVSEEHRTVVAALHALELAARFADRLLVLTDEGRLAASGPPDEVLHEDLIARVFHMKAAVRHAPDVPPRITYQEGLKV